MHMNRFASALAITSLLLAACGGGAAPTQQPAAATQAGGGGTPTDATGATQQPAATNAGGGPGTDVETVAKGLVPPHSTEITKTTAEGTSFVVYESTDSVDSLKAFYADAVPKTGLKIFSTTTINGGVSYVIATDDSGSFGGAVNIYPSGNGKTAVQVTVGKT
jgi:hypothetical protein